MSLILEALKKSEAKRRLGEAPDLGTPFTAPRRRSVVLPVAILLIAAVLAWWGFVSGSRSVAPQTEKSGVASGVTTARPGASVSGSQSGATLHSVTGDNNMQAGAAPTNLPKPSAGHQDAFVATAPPPGLRPTLADEPATPGGAARRASVERRERAIAAGEPPPALPPPVAVRPSMPQPKLAVAPEASGGARGVGRNGAPATAKAPATSTSASAKPVVSVAAKAPATNPATAPAMPASSTAKPAVSVATKAPATAAATPAQPSVIRPAASAPATAETAPMQRAAKTPDTIGLPSNSTPSTPTQTVASAPPYSELAFSVRKSLPELRLSMHVYTADPARRFVILNDSRLGEGDKTNDEVFVHEIRPDGVVLGFQNQRFFYPRDGL